MNGLELRKAALEAAGWLSVEYDWDGLTLYSLINPQRDVITKTQANEADVWQRAPAVESSVDAALRWLVLGEGCNWTLASYIAGLVEPGWIARITGEGGRTVFCDTDTLAVAMCQAYLQYKAGA